MYNKNASRKYHFNQYELNVNIYKCFRTGAKQSKHNMCGSKNIYQGRWGGVQTRRQENSLDSVFCFRLFCVALNLQPINRGVPIVLFQRGSIVFQGVQLFRRTGGGGGGGPNVTFYRNPYITCAPLWIRECIITFIHPVHPC